MTLTIPGQWQHAKAMMKETPNYPEDDDDYAVWKKKVFPTFFYIIFFFVCFQFKDGMEKLLFHSEIHRHFSSSLLNIFFSSIIFLYIFTCLWRVALESARERHLLNGWNEKRDWVFNSAASKWDLEWSGRVLFCARSELRARVKMQKKEKKLEKRKRLIFIHHEQHWESPKQFPALIFSHFSHHPSSSTSCCLLAGSSLGPHRRSRVFARGLLILLLTHVAAHSLNYLSSHLHAVCGKQKWIWIF